MSEHLLHPPKMQSTPAEPPWVYKQQMDDPNATITPRFDTNGREWCAMCQEYLGDGHLHKGSPEHAQMSEKAREQGMSFDGLQKHAINPTHQFIFDRIMRLEDGFLELKLKLEKIWHRQDKKPHKCPVCDGHGGVSNTIAGMQALLTHYDNSCMPCQGKGIVWG